MRKPTAEDVILANRRLFESEDFERYDQNPSIFDSKRQEEIEALIRSHGRADGIMLDVGSGTGNALRIGRRHFARCVGVDLSRPFLLELHRRSPDLLLTQSEAGALPFKSGVFDFCSLYALLHHHPDPPAALRDATRCLKPGGWLYTDHDRNYFFGRFYHLYYKLRYARRPGFGSDLAEIAEYHNTQTGGLNPEHLADVLRSCGCSPVRVQYRLTASPALSRTQRLLRALMRAGLRIHPFRSLHTHFSLLARKA